MRKIPFSNAVADTTRGNTKVQKKSYLTTGDIPVVDQGQSFIAGYTDNLADAYSGTLPVIVFGDHTRAFKFVDFPFALGADGVRILSPKQGIDPEFLFFYFTSLSLPNHGYSRHYKFLKEVEVPFPPLDEQRRIVDILKRADSIRRLRKQALETTRELIPALFVDMFGDPATNPKGWEVATLGEVVAGFEGGKNLQAGADGPANPYRILKVSAVTSGYFRPEEAKPAPDGYAPPANHFVRKDDLLFSRANTVALVGATALVEEDYGNLLLPDKLWRLVWKDPSPVVSAYMQHFLQTRHTRQELGRLATGTSDSMRNISQAKLKTLPVPVPPLRLQAEFASRIESTLAMLRQQNVHSEASECLMQSLMVKLFD